MKIRYDYPQDSESLMVIITAANTDQIVEFEGGRQCHVKITDLDLSNKAALIEKIKTVGIEGASGFPASQKRAEEFKSDGYLWNYKTYTRKIFTDNSKWLIMFKDQSNLFFTVEIKPIPFNTENEEDFVQSGGRISRGCGVQ